MSEQKKPKGSQEPNTNPIPLLATGIFVGVVSSLAGVGGGVFPIPIMYSLLRFPLKRALGTPSATIVITGLAAAAGYGYEGRRGNALLPDFTLGDVGYLYALPVVVTSMPMAQVGASVAHATQPALLKKIFAAYLLVVAATMFSSNRSLPGQFPSDLLDDPFKINRSVDEIRGIDVDSQHLSESVSRNPSFIVAV